MRTGSLRGNHESFVCSSVASIFCSKSCALTGYEAKFRSLCENRLTLFDCCFLADVFLIFSRLVFLCTHRRYISGSKRLHQTDCAFFPVTSVDLHIPVVLPCGGGLWLISFQLVWFGSKAIPTRLRDWSCIPTLEFSLDLGNLLRRDCCSGQSRVGGNRFLGVDRLPSLLQEAR